MTESVFKAVGVCIICCICALVVRQYKPELSLFVQLAGLVVVITVGVGLLSETVDFCVRIFNSEIIEIGYLNLIFKALAIAVVSKIGGDLCRDSGNSALAFGVELMAKAAILLLTLPMLSNLTRITSGLLKG